MGTKMNVQNTYLQSYILNSEDTLIVEIKYGHFYM